MIPYNELRIGNYVLANERLQKVSMINQDNSFSVALPGSETVPGAGHRPETISPVVLSADILQRCGFLYHNYFKFWQLIEGEASDRSEMDVDDDFNILDFMRRPLVKKVASLHQLQNIYFVLKGKELDFRAG